MKSFLNPDPYSLLKLHGCINNPATMVVFPSKYKDLYEKKQYEDFHNPDERRRILFLLENIIANNTILFLGYGMKDIQINDVFRRINTMLKKSEEKHFIISPDKEILKGKEDFLEHIPVDENFKQLPKIIEEILRKKQGSPDFQRITNEIIAVDDRLTKKDDNIVKLLLGLYRDGLNNHKNSRLGDAIKNFEIANKIAEEIRFNDSFILNSWANLLVDVAITNEGKNHVDDCFNKFKEAISKDENNSIAYKDWGNALYKLAESEADTNPSQAETYLAESFKKYKASLEKQGEGNTTFYSWVIALKSLYRIRFDKPFSTYLQEHLCTCPQYEDIKPIQDTEHYLMALCYAHIGDKDSALDALDKAFVVKEIGSDIIKRSDVWMQQFDKAINEGLSDEHYHRFQSLMRSNATS